MNQETPPSVIHGWKATDLLLMMVKRKIYFRNPISRQNFANAFAETPNLNLEVRRNSIRLIYSDQNICNFFANEKILSEEIPK